MYTSPFDTISTLYIHYSDSLGIIQCSMMSRPQGNDAPGLPVRLSCSDSYGRLSPALLSLDPTCILPSKSRACCILIGAAQVDPMTPACSGCP